MMHLFMKKVQMLWPLEITNQHSSTKLQLLTTPFIYPHATSIHASPYNPTPKPNP